MKNWWNPEIFLKNSQNRHIRQTVIRAIRHFFEDELFDEVETPAIQVCPGMEVHLKAFETRLDSFFDASSAIRYLHTSPELSMKKLLVAGCDKIYQLCHTYRNEEDGQTHLPEFLMLEWYRCNTTYEQMMQDTIDIVRQATSACQKKELRFENRTSDPFEPWQKLTICDAFALYANIDLTSCLPETADLEPNPDKIRNEAVKIGIQCSDSDRFEDIFFRIMLDKIEPFLGDGVPTILYDYPTCLGALARRKPTDERFVERFEVYACGVELCNAFSELTDATEQKTRFLHDQKMKLDLYGQTYPIDEDFLNALAYGMPNCSGNALGVDRLVMLISGASNIHDCVWIPKL